VKVKVHALHMESAVQPLHGRLPCVSTVDLATFNFATGRGSLVGLRCPSQRRAICVATVGTRSSLTPLTFPFELGGPSIMHHGWPRQSHLLDSYSISSFFRSEGSSSCRQHMRCMPNHFSTCGSIGRSIGRGGFWPWGLARPTAVNGPLRFRNQQISPPVESARVYSDFAVPALGTAKLDS